MPPARSTSAVRVGHLAGIPIGIQPLWLVIVSFLTYALGHDYFPVEDPALSSTAAYALGLVSALGLFGGIVLHELGHAIVARGRGVEVDEIDLWLLGGVSRLHGEAKRPQDELAFALAGPAVTAALLGVIGMLRLTLGGSLPAWGRALLDYQLIVSAMILGFNLLPAFPLDGGRVMRSLLWWRLGDAQRATAIAARLGRAFGWLFVALGVVSLVGGVSSGIWLALVGGFLVIASGAEARQSRAAHVFADVPVADVMTAPVVVLPASLSLEDAADEFAEHLFSTFPVVDDAGVVLGLLAIDQVRTTPPAMRGTTCVGDVAIHDLRLLVDGAMPVETLLELPMFARVGRAVVVDTAGTARGIVSITDLERRLRASEVAAPDRQLTAVRS